MPTITETITNMLEDNVVLIKFGKGPNGIYMQAEQVVECDHGGLTNATHQAEGMTVQELVGYIKNAVDHANKLKGNASPKVMVPRKSLLK